MHTGEYVSRFHGDVHGFQCHGFGVIQKTSASIKEMLFRARLTYGMQEMPLRIDAQSYEIKIFLQTGDVGFV